MIKIAVSGKGGVGKTTFAGTLARLLTGEGYDVLAIDADPSMNLASSLGITNQPQPLTDYKELIDERAGGMDGMFKINPKVDDITERFGVIGPDGVKLLTMGTVVRGGGGCMCPASSFLQALLRHVVLKDTSVVIIDMEAGIEHLGRGITRGINLMIIIVEPGTRSIQTAQRVVELGEEIGIKHFAAVINKAKESAPIKKRLAELNIRAIGSIPYDPLLVEADINGLAPLDVGGKAVESIKKIKDRILNKYSPDKH